MVKNLLSIVQAIFKILAEKLTYIRKESSFHTVYTCTSPSLYDLSSLKCNSKYFDFGRCFLSAY